MFAALTAGIAGPSIDLTSASELLLIGTLASMRLIVILSFAPMFVELAVPASLRAAAALALSAPLLPIVELPMVDGRLSLWTMVLLSAKEMVVGVLLLLIIGLPFWAVDMAGDIIDVQRGVGNESLSDPAELVDSQPIGRLLFLIFLLLVIVSGGLVAIMAVIYDSYIVIPVAELPDLGVLIRKLLDTRLFEDLFDYALLIVLPALLLLLLTDSATALITRFAPQLNALQLAMILKGVVLFAFIPLYGPALTALLEPLLAELLARHEVLKP